MKKKYILILLLIFSIVFAREKTSLNISKPKIEKAPILSGNEDSIFIKNKELKEKDFKVFILKGEKNNLFKDILPLISLFLGFFLNRGFDYFTERKRIKKSGEHWKAELSNLREPILKQIENVKLFLIERNKEKYNIPNITIFSSLDCTAFDSLNKSDLIKYFEKFKSTKHPIAIKNSSSLNFLIVILKDIFDKLKDKYNEYLRETSKFTNSLNVNLNELLNDFRDYATLIQKELEPNPEKLYEDTRFIPLALLIEKQIKSHQNNSDYDIYVLEEKFFKPFIEELAKLRNDERTKALYRTSKNGITDIQRLKREKEYLNIHFNKVIERYNECLPDIETAIIKLSKN